MTPINPTAALQIFELMPLVVLNFGLDGKVLYANAAATAHPGKPAESMNNKPLIKSLVRDMAMGKIKFPFATEVALAGDIKVKGVFIAGFARLEMAFIEIGAVAVPPTQPQEMVLGGVIALVKDELERPLRRVSNALDKLPESAAGLELQAAADALNQRLNRMTDLIAVFGEELSVTSDRIDLPEMVAAVCAALAPKAKERRVHFAIKPPSTQLPPVYGNARIIRRAFTECFENAIQHSRRAINSCQELAIRVSFTLTGQYVLISITNLGAMPDNTKRIETRDAFLGTKNTRTAGRLGLPLVERIAGLQGGKMRIGAVGDDEVRVLLEFPTGANQNGQAQLTMAQAQAQRYATDLAELMAQRKKVTS